jgi:hypothetical protein
MKKLLFFAIISIVSLPSFGQALVKGNFDIRVGTGFGVYTLTTNDYEDNTTGAVPGLLNVGVGYQITDAFVLGIDFERNGFVTDPDSNNRAISQNFGLTAGYNFLNKEKNVLQAFLHVGSSTFTFENLDNQNDVKASGTQIQLGLAWRHYFGEVAGMFINFSIPYYSYNEFKNSDGDVYEVGRTTIVNGQPKYESKVFQATMTGMNLRVGLALKFGG